MPSPSTSLTQLIKKCAIEAFNASKPCDYRTGTIIKTDPLTVQISQNVVIPKDFLLLTRRIANTGLEVNDKVLMIRKAGGQQYVIIDEVVSA